jgi:hypothetical protein
VVAADPIKRKIETAGFGLTDHIDEVLGFVVNGDRPETGQEFVAAPRLRVFRMVRASPALVTQVQVFVFQYVPNPLKDRSWIVS